MGRVSVPIMNKTGYSMYWDSIWDDKINYSRSLKDGIFLKEFIRLFFEGGSYSMFFFNLSKFKKNFKYLKRRYFFHIKKIPKKNDFGNIVRYQHVIDRNERPKTYLSKIWILKYQSWIIIYFYAYTFKLSVFFRKKINFKKKYYKYTNIISKYYNSLFKIKYNYEYYKKFYNLKNF